MFSYLRRIRLKEYPYCRKRHLVQFQKIYYYINSQNRHMSSNMSVTPPTYPNFDRSYLRHNFYPEEEDPDLIGMFESSSMQQVFDIYTSIPKETLSVKHSAQALAALWDIQKFMFGIGHIFDPSESAEFKNRHHYVATLREHPVLQEIVRHVSSNVRALEDEPLAVSLLCLKKMQFGVRSSFAQEIIQELLNRKSRLSLPALSRVFVAMRHESIYGFTIMSEFLPLISSLVPVMSTDQDFCLISIALRNALSCSTQALQCQYIERLYQVLREGSVEFEVTTLCKIIAFLFEISFHVIKVQEGGSGEEKIVLSSDLLRQVCNLLYPRVPEMDEMNVLSLSKFSDFNQEPVPFVNAITKRAVELLEQNPSIDLMSTIQPKTFAQQNKLAEFLHKYLNDCPHFEHVTLLVFRILKKTHFDSKLHHKYWSRVTELLLKQENEDPSPEDPLAEYFDEDTATDFTDEGLMASSPGSILKRKFLVFAHEYINLRRGTCRTFTHPELEFTVTRLILQLLKDYDAGKTILVPKDYAKSLAFLLATGHRNLDIRASFLQNLRIEDLILIQKGAELSRRSNAGVMNTLSKRSERLLMEGSRALDYIGVAKLNLKVQKNFEFHPVFTDCISAATRNELWKDSRVAKELLTMMISSGFYHPAALERVGRLISELEKDVAVVVAERFLWASFIFGAEGIQGVQESARIVSRNFNEMHPLPLLESALGLCFQGCLEDDMIAKTFCVEFLDEVDRYIKATNFHSQTPRRLREVFMELNRAVCLDMPGANIPWFHQKYCEEVAAAEGFPNDTYLHKEVAYILEDVLGSGYFQRRVYSPYFYPIDFLLELNQRGQPMKGSSKPSQNKTGGTRIAIIVHRPKDFSSNNRKLKGRHVLMKRHLEIMGYRVISIDPNKWNSMHMSEQSAKSEYLESCIFN